MTARSRRLPTAIKIAGLVGLAGAIVLAGRWALRTTAAAERLREEFPKLNKSARSRFLALVDSYRGDRLTAAEQTEVADLTQEGAAGLFRLYLQTSAADRAELIADLSAIDRRLPNPVSGVEVRM